MWPGTVHIGVAILLKPPYSPNVSDPNSLFPVPSAQKKPERSPFQKYFSHLMGCHSFSEIGYSSWLPESLCISCKGSLVIGFKNFCACRQQCINTKRDHFEEFQQYIPIRSVNYFYQTQSHYFTGKPCIYASPFSLYLMLF